MKPLRSILLATAGVLTLMSASLGQAAGPVRFSDALHEKFHHPQCLNCHQFNNPRQSGRSYTSHRNRYLCDNCHTAAITGIADGEWFAPVGTRMDYTGMNARDTCLLIKRNTPSGDLKTRLTEHLLDDVRIHWALESGMTPAGQGPTVPGGYAAWVKDVKAWVNDGMICE